MSQNGGGGGVFKGLPGSDVEKDRSRITFMNVESASPECIVLGMKTVTKRGTKNLNVGVKYLVIKFACLGSHKCIQPYDLTYT